MSRIERLTERSISFALAEVDEDLAVARLVFLAQDDHAALDAAIGACLARTEHTLYVRRRAISFLVRIRYEDEPIPANRSLPAPAARATAIVELGELLGELGVGARCLSRRRWWWWPAGSLAVCWSPSESPGS
jgi:HEAT repeat protein